MDASLHLCAGDFLETAGGFLDRIVAWLVIPNAACESLGRLFWKEENGCLPETAGNAQFQFAVIYRNLARIGDLDRILAVLLSPQRELLALDLLKSSRGKEIQHHILCVHDFRIC